MSYSRLAVSAAIAAAALALITSRAPAQSPPAGAPPAAPAAPAQQAEPAPAPPAPGAPEQPKDPFGEEVTLEARTVVVSKGEGNWDAALATLKDAFKAVSDYAEKQRLKANGPIMALYMSRDDTGFQYQVELPIAEAPKSPPKGDISIGTSPAGKALKFVHRGSYDAMETTYEAITNYLDDKGIDASDIIEEYVTDPLKTPEEQWVVNIYVPLK